MPASQRRWSVFAAAALAVAVLAPSGPGRAQSYEAQLEVRVSTLEQQISQLTGQIEQLQYQNQQLADQLKRAQADIEFRLNELEGGGGGAKAAPAPAPARKAPSQGSAPAAPRTPQPFTPTPLVPPKRSDAGPVPQGYEDQGDSLTAPQEMGAAEPGPAPQVPGFASTEPQSYGLGGAAPVDATAAYNQAQGLYNRGDYNGAIAGFNQVIAASPGGGLAGNAQYWLGESLLAVGRPGEAANAFNAAWSMDPRGPRAPDALMRLAQSLVAARQDRPACDAFARLVADYPDAPAQMLRRAKDQQLLMRC
ncbi:tol-pal system protein YbgF [Inquilinus limosus]|uniref:Cell division coordinator CpoB n=1 Tax=Inquilinus limosus TaxID=171674 RepID=A0A211ZLR5_9PROT|nr:tol-pal system protein YbgF [Inquilinus limosus]OWJ66225.1 tol-pal system protein YbgF [Inquilinus limosus]